MRRALVLIGAVIGVAAASVAAADPRDAVDRGQRLDTDALRDDMGINRLRVPSHPLVIAPTQPAPSVEGAKKRKKSSATSGSNR
ncbi:hypothetical protein [Bradyrhizobium liaoningense]|uniref:hypothetical protein n=1 Tax=Bradyrhizobium liaoningense TaxID=43992 RepID=UPI001BAC549B|nr:hypothetical protein [Bradyrhizobium liaoningense]MBR0712393.1 hypothetical protein [Bradyrhizobium liaoningense]